MPTESSHLALLQDPSNSAHGLTPFNPRPAASLTFSPNFQGAACEDCKRLVDKLLDEWPTDDMSRWSRSPYYPSSQSTWYCNEKHHDGLLSTLAESSKSCLICAVIITQIRFENRELANKHKHYKLTTRANSPHSFNAWVTNNPNDSKTLIRGKTLAEFGLYHRRAPPDKPVAEQGIVYMSRPSNGRVNFTPHLVPLNFPCYEKALDKIKSWMNTCDKDHDICHKTRQQAYLPKRVVKIVSDNQVSLYFPGKEEIAPFATVSYRWGDGPPLRTTKENIESIKAGISISELPDTLRDAVLLSRGLGFEFLWIDALCIIQNDTDDWAEQSAEMANIYRRSSLNLCAADGKSCSSGMLERAAPHLLEIATESTTATAATIPTDIEETIVFVGSPSIPYTTSFACGLESRGWVFQECLSSVCSLYVSRRHGLVWNCCTMLDTIDWKEPYLLTSASNHIFNPLTLKRSWAGTIALADEEPSIENQGRKSGLEPVEARPSLEPRTRLPNRVNPRLSLHRRYSNIWYDWTEDYTSRKLTTKSDRLPAVAGLASSIASTSGMTYAAGLWQNDILPGLTWRAEPGMVKRIPGSAPSWSWGSVTGPVHYSEFFSMAVDHRGGILKEPELDLNVLDINIDEVSPGRFGQVTRGEIKATGVMKRAVTMLGQKRWTPKCDLDEYTLRKPDRLDHFGDGGVSKKDYGLFESYEFLRLMCVYRNKDNSDGPFSYFLIVEKTGEKEDEFRRVGMGKVNMHWPSTGHLIRIRHGEQVDHLEPVLTEEELWAGAPRVELSLV